MSGTRSPSRTAPATDAALLVVHGSPSDDAPQQAAVADLAARVADRLPGWRIEGATLATQGHLEAALARLGPAAAVVVPVFMADGWFVRSALPRRLDAAGAPDLPIVAPLGILPAFRDLARRAALEGCRTHGLDPAATTVVLAAHGARDTRAPADSAKAAVAHLHASGLFRAVTPAFVEEPPFLFDVLETVAAPAICVPFFALAAGHVTGDLAEAAVAAGFAGPILPHLGAHPDLPAVIADHLRTGLRDVA